MFLTEFLTVAIIHFLAVVSPGPDFAMTLKNSLHYGRKIGIFTGIGMGLGIGVHIIYSLIGIGLIISQSILLFNVIKYLGAIYLVYIGIKALRSKPQNEINYETDKSKEQISNIKAVSIGFLTNVLNPKATLFFLSLFTQVINPETPFIIQILYGVEMMIVTAVWFSVIAIFFSNKFFKRKILQIRHVIDRVFGVALVALGVKIALSKRD